MNSLTFRTALFQIHLKSKTDLLQHSTHNTVWCDATVIANTTTISWCSPAEAGNPIKSILFQRSLEIVLECGGEFNTNTTRFDRQRRWGSEDCMDFYLSLGIVLAPLQAGPWLKCVLASGITSFYCWQGCPYATSHVSLFPHTVNSKTGLTHWE